MRYLSVCSGIEAATVAWAPLGWTAVAVAEVDPFPCAVLAQHYPTVPNWGDLTRFQEWPDAAVDVLVGGTPCQSFSVAGLRQGLDDPRGSLLLSYLAVARRYRPRWLVWENVPGVLSVDDGRAFGALLGGLAELGYGFAYRVLDAQYFGLAQRRKRVFVVGHLGDWRRAAAVLFERESLSGHPAPRRETGQRIAPSVSCGPPFSRTGNQRVECEALIAPTLPSRRTAGGGLGTDFDCDGGLVPDVSPAIKARDYKGPSSDGDGDGACLVPLIAHTRGTQCAHATEDGTGRGTPLIAFSAKDYGADAGDLAHALRADGFDASEDGTGRGTPLIAFDARQSDVLQYGDQSGPLDTNGHTIAVAAAMSVRRLTPRECERLQGFPDDYTRIPYRGHPAADGPRYKALGNSMAVPVMRWIGTRIAQVDAIPPAEVDV